MASKLLTCKRGNQNLKFDKKEPPQLLASQVASIAGVTLRVLQAIYGLLLLGSEEWAAMLLDLGENLAHPLKQQVPHSVRICR